MKINNTNQTAQTQGNSAFVNLVQNKKDDSKLIAFATVYYNGIKIRDIRIYVNDEGNTFLSFPSKKRLDKQGNAVQKDGKDVYDDIACPCTKEARQEIIDLVDNALEAELTKAA